MHVRDGCIAHVRRYGRAYRSNAYRYGGGKQLTEREQYKQELLNKTVRRLPPAAPRSHAPSRGGAPRLSQAAHAARASRMHARARIAHTRTHAPMRRRRRRRLR